MKNNENTSLVVSKKGLFQKIQDFFVKLFKKEKVEVATFSDEVVENKRETFTETIKVDKNAEIRELAQKIKNGEIKLADKDDEELVEIEERLLRYLRDLQKQVNEKREELNINEKMLLNYRKKLESVNS